MGFKMRPKSPLMKKLVGKQHRLPEHLKAKIEASPAKKKVKFTEDTRSEEYIGDYTKDRTKTNAIPERTTTRDMSLKAQQDNVKRFVDTGDKTPNTTTKTETQSRADSKKVKSDDNLTSTVGGKPQVRNTKVNVKIKGRKRKDGIISDPSNPGASVKDVKKVKMTAGKGRSKKTVKVKYDKQGNVKKETTRYGRFGLSKKKRASGSVAVGTKEGKDLKGAAAAEAIVAKQGSNIRGRKKEGGKDSALTKRGCKSKKY